MNDGTSIGLAQDLYAALGGADRERLSQLLHPEFLGHATEGLPFSLGGDHRGPEAMRRNFWGKIAKNYEARAQPDDFQMLSDGRLLVHGRYLGASRDGADLNAEFVHILTFLDGQISGLNQLTDSARWVDAARGHGSRDAMSAVEFTVENGLATLRMNRPNVHNAIDATMAQDIFKAAQKCANDSSVRALLLLGNGPSFTVGGDLAFISGAGDRELPGLLRAMTSPYHEALRTFSRLSVPIIAGVQGAAAGGGLGMLYCADVVVAADNVRIATGFSALGLSMDGANSWFLPRLVGMRRAAELYFEGRVLDAQEALEWGLVTRVVPLQEFNEHVRTSAQRLAEGPTRAYGEVRRLYRESLTATLSEQLGSETEALFRTAATADARNAITSFLAKRRPSFTGA